MIVMKDETPTSKRAPGRPRGFNRETALTKAMHTFWAHGYETTSVADLTKAMDIKTPALYSAFGDKKKLYLEAMRLYAGDRRENSKAIADAPSSRDAAAAILNNAIHTFTGADTPKGCMVGSGLASGSASAADVRAEGTVIRLDLEKSLSLRIKQDIAAGLLLPETDGDALAALVVCTVQGFSTLARDGATADKLSKIAELVLNNWPVSG